MRSVELILPAATFAAAARTLTSKLASKVASKLGKGKAPALPAAPARE